MWQEAKDRIAVGFRASHERGLSVGAVSQCLSYNAGATRGRAGGRSHHDTEAHPERSSK